MNELIKKYVDHAFKDASTTESMARCGEAVRKIFDPVLTIAERIESGDAKVVVISNSFHESELFIYDHEADFLLRILNYDDLNAPYLWLSRHEVGLLFFCARLRIELELETQLLEDRATAINAYKKVREQK